jgi:hypothetical protein
MISSKLYRDIWLGDVFFIQMGFASLSMRKKIF